MEEQKRPRKKKRGRNALIVLGVLVVVGLILHWPTESGFTISRETTYVTGPLNPDGTINYVAALNEMMSKGVTPENNAAPLLIRIWGAEIIREPVRARVFEILKMEPVPEEGVGGADLGYVVEDMWPKGAPKGAATRPTREDVYEQTERVLKRAMEGPWSADELPAVAAWLKDNEEPLSLIIEATKRPRYYLPLVGKSSPPRLYDVQFLFPLYLSLAEALSARAMLKLDGGDIDGATADLLAAHRLARLVVQAPLLLNKFIALAVEKTAAQGTIALANSGRLAPNQARRMLLELNTAGPMPEIVDALDRSERLFMLDFVMLLYAGYSLDGTDLEPLEPLVSRKYYGTAIDWDRMLRNFNRWFDRMVAAVREPNPRKRDEAVKGLISELQRMNLGTATIIKLILGRLGGRASKAIMTDALSNLLIRILTPVFSHLPDSRYQAVVRYDLARVALAMAAFKAEKGKYPEKLSELSPAYIKKVPADVFAEGPFVYKRVGKGYLLYSVGENIKDDGGVEDEDGDEDDIVVRVK